MAIHRISDIKIIRVNYDESLHGGDSLGKFAQLLYCVGLVANKVMVVITTWGRRSV